MSLGRAGARGKHVSDVEKIESVNYGGKQVRGARRRPGVLTLDVLTPKRLFLVMEVIAMSENAKRSTVYFDPDLHRALRIKAAHTRRTLSDLVNEAVRMTLAEDQEDLAAFDERVDERTITYEELLKDLKAHGKI